MPKHLACLVVSFALVPLGAVASAQESRFPSPVSVSVSVKPGTIRGVVSDDAGQTVAGVAITAIGTTHAQAKTDLHGRFTLPLVPGEYILRAAREGYISPYRESVRISASALIEKNITITRHSETSTRKILLASGGVSLVRDLPAVPETAPARTESLQAWYLRHLPRTVLRDTGHENGLKKRGVDIRHLPSFLDWAVGESARLATSFFADTDFTGQVNFLTTSALAPSSDRMPNTLGRGIAYVSVGAPVGLHGDWRVRGAMSAGDVSSWVMLGEYEARDAQEHAFRIGMSFGAQAFTSTASAAVLAPKDGARSVGGLYAFDRWHVRPGLSVDYGFRVDRYDYVAGQDFLSPRLGVRIAVLPRTFITALASSAVVAPGADEFLPPPTSGPWLPPERTFSAFVPGTPFRSERVSRYEVGLEREFGLIGQTRSVGLRRFRESARDQVATIFGLDAARGSGHYYVATPGSVSLDGWSLKVSGHFTQRVKASVDYSVSRAHWDYGVEALAISNVLPSALRPVRERLHDVTTTVEVNVPETSTKVSLAHRMNSAFSRPMGAGLEPVFDGRFDVQLRQALPFQLLRGANVEFLAAISNLFRDPARSGSFYDELLTVKAPRRVLGGVQVRF